MAYFSNGSEGSAFETECYQCRFGGRPCPIAWVQIEHNYDAVNNPVATKILGHLVDDGGACRMLRTFPELRIASMTNLNGGA